MRRLMNKKGQLGLNIVRSTMTQFLVLAVVAIAVILALVSLNDANIFTAGSQADVKTNEVINNITTATSDFFGNTGTIFAILVVVAIILAISIVIGVVSRFGGSGGGL